jgi:glycosyltransferase involved in cell wall biosynthesis
MRVGIVAPPFISVPPKVYGGTELFIAQLAEGLQKVGVEVVVYANGESTVGVPTRWLYPESQWPLEGEIYDSLKDFNHTSWAVHDAVADCDVVHLNNVPGLFCSRFVNKKFVYTIHHPHLQGLTEIYRFFANVQYVTISDFQQRQETMPLVRTIHHGIDLSSYQLQQAKQDYLVFLGRIAPIKGTHLAIEAAKKAGIPLKIAGEIQPQFRDYFDSEIKPHVDGKFIEYVGEADLPAKNELLGNACATLFPIQWDEPFGLVMIESMACGTPVLALAGGSVAEVIETGVNGFVCRSTDELAARVEDARRIPPVAVRQNVKERFSLERMVMDYYALYRQLLTAADVGEISELAKEDQAAIA